ncbi:MAG: 50S ribosomal protein L9 [Proteobacteria bacterium]|nr:50S ribosomal protein L9 [Pseudomonadota bacterium]
MNVILLEKIGKLGEIGDTASVKAGYARNFLFPQGKAIPATKTNLAEFEGRKTELLAKHDAKVAESQRRAERVNGVSLTIEVNASDEGHLFGSVGTREIAEAVNALAGSDIAKSEVLLPNGAIRELGAFEVALDLGHDVHATISLAVVGLKSAAGVSDDGSIIEEIDQREAAEAAEAAAASAAEAIDTPAAEAATEMSAQPGEAAAEEAPDEAAVEAVSEIKSEADDSKN